MSEWFFFFSLSLSDNHIIALLQLGLKILDTQTLLTGRRLKSAAPKHREEKLKNHSEQK